MARHLTRLFPSVPDQFRMLAPQTIPTPGRAPRSRCSGGRKGRAASSSSRAVKASGARPRKSKRSSGAAATRSCLARRFRGQTGWGASRWRPLLVGWRPPVGYTLTFRMAAASTRTWLAGSRLAELLLAINVSRVHLEQHDLQAMTETSALHLNALKQVDRTK